MPVSHPRKTLRATLFGSWLRIITTLIVATNVALVAMVIAFLVFSGRESLFRVDTRTDFVSFVADGEMVWARADYRFREGETAPCKSGKTVVPAGTAIDARLDMDGTSFVLAVPPAGKPLTLQCAEGGEYNAQYVVIWFAKAGSEMPRIKDFRGLAMALSASPSPVAAVPVDGIHLRIGGAPDVDSGMSHIGMIRDGTLTSETESWPIPSSSVVTSRALAPGDILTFENPARGERSKADSRRFSGLLVVTNEGLRLLARARAAAAYITTPNAVGGKPAIVAPTMLLRLQAQAEWGVFLLIGAMLLSILGAMRAFLLEEETMFDWAHATPHDSKAAQSAATAIFLTIAIGFAANGGPAHAQSLTAYPVFRIEGPSGVGQGFAILNPAGTPHCLLVTSDHVVKPGERVTLIGQRPNTASQIAPMRVSAEYLDRLGPGLVVIEPEGGVNLGDCAPMAQPERADYSYESDGGGRLTFVDPQGSRQFIFVDIASDPRIDSRLQVKGRSVTQIAPGISGSPMSINGKLLAVAEEVANGVAYVTRLDTIKIDARYVGVQRAVETQRGRFNVEGFPAKYVDVATRTRAVVAKAQNVQRLAQINAQGAMDASHKADGLFPGYGKGNLTDKDRVWAGQVNSKGEVEGLGILRFVSGEAMGDEILGRYQFGDKSVSRPVGPAVRKYFDPSKNSGQRQIEVDLYNGINGPGVLTFADGSVSWTEWVNGANNSVGGYHSGGDKSYFEAIFANGKMNGLGIRWSHDGQPMCLCEWKDGIVVRDETNAILAKLK